MRAFAPTSNIAVATPKSAARAVNALGVELHKQMPKVGNVCFSPYSIQMVLGMTYLGASGVTQEEMARVLHLPKEKKEAGESFAALRKALDEVQKESERDVEERKESYDQARLDGIELIGVGEALTLHVANRLFGQEGHDFRAAFLTDVEACFGAPLQPMDFSRDPAGATSDINRWVEDQTRGKICDLIPPGMLTCDTRMVLANAVYFKASWANEFQVDETVLEPFHVNGGMETADVPMMRKTDWLRCCLGPGFQAVLLPYQGMRLHFLLIVPDRVDGLAAVEAGLTAEVLYDCCRGRGQEVILHLPKFKIAPPASDLSGMLRAMGMATAFDQPRGSADFDAMAPWRTEDYLFISNVLHKTFLEIDEKGTEAAAATVMMMAGGCAGFERPKPLEIKADRPFLFAIQHAMSGACLFLGRVGDPR
ncbi:serpin family protein [Prosthecobacter sp.]|uniref:serpin family protein n=1 Tax=Prosthecobacter sp. TaxID=1965333 RepID=UPI0037849726